MGCSAVVEEEEEFSTVKWLSRLLHLKLVMVICFTVSYRHVKKNVFILLLLLSCSGATVSKLTVSVNDAFTTVMWTGCDEHLLVCSNNNPHASMFTNNSQQESIVKVCKEQLGMFHYHSCYRLALNGRGILE